jgi:hypothetical protein
MESYQQLDRPSHFVVSFDATVLLLEFEMRLYFPVRHRHRDSVNINKSFENC